MEKLRSVVRPLLSLSFTAVILSLTIYLAVKYGDSSLAKDYALFVLASGGTLIGFWFGQRKANG